MLQVRQCLPELMQRVRPPSAEEAGTLLVLLTLLGVRLCTLVGGAASAPRANRSGSTGGGSGGGSGALWLRQLVGQLDRGGPQLIPPRDRAAVLAAYAWHVGCEGVDRLGVVSEEGRLEWVRTMLREVGMEAARAWKGVAQHHPRGEGGGVGGPAVIMAAQVARAVGAVWALERLAW